VHQAPRWARSPAWDDRAQAMTNNNPKRYPDDPTTITPWAKWAAGYYKPWVAEWEVWNEPNLVEFTGYNPWPSKTPRCSPLAYVQLAKAFAAGARAGNPDVKLIGPNTSGCDWRFLDGCYTAGLKDTVDIIGVHAYQGRQSVPPPSTDTSGIAKAAGWERYRLAYGLPRVHQVMSDRGDGAKPIWNTESGWAADSESGVGNVGVPGTWASRNDKSAEFTYQWLEMLTRTDNPAFRAVRLSTCYQLYDPQSTDSHQKAFGFIYRDGGLKPQAKALAKFRRAHPVLRTLY
jgi:hypothetical protein